MLVLTRKYQEKIRIGDNITITVLRTKGKAVRLGIEAPANVPVIRGELSFETTGADADVEMEESSDEVMKPRVASQRTPSWAAESPLGESSRSSDERSPKVELTRVSRSEVRAMMPKLADGTAPLRAMMSSRV
jgi:carbon storage regulator CsrA